MGAGVKLKLIELRDKLLAEGGPEQIALFLAGQGIKGVRTSNSSCPVANYIRREIDYVPMVSVGTRHMGAGAGADWDSVDFVNTPLERFIRGFDSGRFPELEA